MVDVSAFRLLVSGRTDIAKEVAKLQRLERANLRKELRAAMASASKPARMRVKADEMAFLPKRNGMAKKYAHVPTQTYSVSGDQVSMKWKQHRKGSDLESLNRGRIRHPLFGHKRTWYNQAITPGMWSLSVKKEGAPIVDDMTRQLIEYTERIARG